MGTPVRPGGPGRGYPSDRHAGFVPRKRRPDGTLEPLICTCELCGRRYEYDSNRGHTKIRCNSCRANGWASRPDRVETKRKLVAIRGGACQICGYDRHLGALTFHHVEPLTKSLNIASNHNRNWDVLVHEVRKCVLLCMNCHREVHDGAAQIPPESAREVAEYIKDAPRDRILKPEGRPRNRPDPLPPGSARR